MQTVLTTGANSGIGLDCVLEIARKGYRSIGSVRSEAKAEVVHKAAAKAGGDAGPVLLAVAPAPRCASVIDEFGPLYGLVNTAGYGVPGAVEDVSDAEAAAVLDRMVLAPMRLARLAIPGMRAAGTGR